MKLDFLWCLVVYKLKQKNFQSGQVLVAYLFKKLKVGNQFKPYLKSSSYWIKNQAS